MKRKVDVKPEDKHLVVYQARGNHYVIGFKTKKKALGHANAALKSGIAKNVSLRKK